MSLMTKVCHPHKIYKKISSGRHVYMYVQTGRTDVQIKNAVCTNINIIDASIKHPILGQSTHMVKGCVDIMF